MKLSSRLCTLALAVAVLPLLGPVGAHASDDDETIRRGACSGSADWKIKAKPDDGRIEVEAEIDSNKTGQTWRWVLRHDGTRSARGTATTTGRSGSFSVERKTVDHAGVDSFTFRAVHQASGQVCVARVSL